MPSKLWLPRIDGQIIKVEAKWSSWTGGGKIFVNGMLSETWKSNIGGGLTKIFQIEYTPAVLRATHNSFELHIDGSLVEANSG